MGLADQTGSACSQVPSPSGQTGSINIIDHMAVHNSISQVAQDINEIKRRKDLGEEV